MTTAPAGRKREVTLAGQGESTTDLARELGADRIVNAVAAHARWPEGAVVVLSAHGVAPEVYERSRERQLHVLDATPDGIELVYCRQRFIVECVAAGVVAVDCPYTWSDIEGAERDTRWARRLGYVAKSLVDPAHAAVINDLLAPDDHELRRARDIVTAFEAARAAGEARVEVDGSLIEVPTYHTAKRLLARGEAMRQFERASPA